MSPEERLKTVRENHACFSCLKKAGRDHRASNCSRRKQCTQKISGVQCKYYHHVLLHPSNPTASVGVASVENNTEAMMPVITVKISGKNNRHKQGLHKYSKEFGFKGKGCFDNYYKSGR
jgi:hypothetical protein